jgi:hypothetical protein
MKTGMFRSIALTFVGASLLASPALADDPKFEFGKVEEVKAVKGVEWDASAEFGLVLTTGNSEVTTMTGGAKASRKTGKNKLTMSVDGTYAQSGIRRAKAGVTTVSSASDIETVDTVSAKNLTGKARYDRYLTELNSLFLGIIAKTDVPAGIKVGGSAQAGYSRSLYKSEKYEAVSEIGYDYTFTRFDAADAKSTNVHSARIYAAFKGKMNDATNLDTSVEALPNLNKFTLPTGEVGIGEGTRVNFHVGITSKLTKSLSVNTSLDLKYANSPAPLSLPGVTFAAGFSPESAQMDSILKASLIYSFF